MLSELDLLVESTRERDLMPVELVDMQTNIAALRHSLSGFMATAEGNMLRAKEAHESYLIREKLRLQAIDPKLSTAKATDQIEGTLACEKMRLAVIDRKVDYMVIKTRMDASKDVLVGLAIKVGLLRAELVDANTQHSNA